MSGVAIVTGGAGGIGSAIARRLVDAGMTVVAADLERALAAAGSGGADGIEHEAVDVTSSASVAALVEAAASRGPLRAVVNCAGILRETRVEAMTDEDVDLLLAVNLAGAIRVTRVVAPLLEEGAAIVNISSIAAAAGSAPGVSVYSATKAGLEGFTRATAVELARRGIRVNAVAPGFVRAPMSAGMRSAGDERLKRLVPLRRLAEPEEIAEVVEFLLSPRASYVTGIVLVVDGGILAT